MMPVELRLGALSSHIIGLASCWSFLSRLDHLLAESYSFGETRRKILLNSLKAIAVWLESTERQAIRPPLENQTC